MPQAPRCAVSVDEPRRRWPWRTWRQVQAADAKETCPTDAGVAACPTDAGGAACLTATADFGHTARRGTGMICTNSP